jgi:hypothetical protein
MSAEHNRLDALRRLAKDRAETPAEKAFSGIKAARIDASGRRWTKPGS